MMILIYSISAFFLFCFLGSSLFVSITKLMDTECPNCHEKSKLFLIHYYGYCFHYKERWKCKKCNCEWNINYTAQYMKYSDKVKDAICKENKNPYFSARKLLLYCIYYLSKIFLFFWFYTKFPFKEDKETGGLDLGPSGTGYIPRFYMNKKLTFIQHRIFFLLVSLNMIFTPYLYLKEKAFNNWNIYYWVPWIIFNFIIILFFVKNVEYRDVLILASKYNIIQKSKITYYLENHLLLKTIFNKPIVIMIMSGNFCICLWYIGEIKNEWNGCILIIIYFGLLYFMALFLEDLEYFGGNLRKPRKPGL